MNPPESHHSKAETNFDSVIDFARGFHINNIKTLYETLAVNGADLVEMDRGWQGEAIRLVGLHDHFDGIRRRRKLRRNRRHDGDAAVPIPDVVLNDQGRSGLLDLVALGGVAINGLLKPLKAA